jgi:antitoxin component HigA of HigAB toxin-antitoxin module
MSFLVPKKESVDAVTRERIAAWLEHEMDQRGLSTNVAVAELMGVSAAAVSRVRSRSRTPGLDFVLAMWRKLHIPLVPMLEQMPQKGAAPRRLPTRG